MSVSCEVRVHHQPEDCLVLLELEGHRGDVRHLGQGGHQDVGVQVVSKPARRQFQIMIMIDDDDDDNDDDVPDVLIVSERQYLLMKDLSPLEVSLYYIFVVSLNESPEL